MNNPTSPYSKQLQLSTFTSKCSQNEVQKTAIKIHHRLATTISQVGSQVWLGSLLLLDYLYHIKADIRHSTVLEIGAGTGLCSIYSSKLGARLVYCTDIRQGMDQFSLLDLIRLNVEDNNCSSNVLILELDLTDETHLVYSLLAEVELDSYNLPSDNLAEISISYIIAADIIYDDYLTFHFIRRLPSLLSDSVCNSTNIKGRKLILALERRINFTIKDMAPVAHARNFMLTTLEALNADRADEGLAEIKHERIDLQTFPQVFEYERNEYLELYCFSM
ncbi:hypothetical protein SeLEV6574_g01899 [Synchytrium endobioticum]|uniref:Methyltransferase-like protein 22 n=1 Tax=Synchytrium endobioticum TaxID=286115 RepID=A0A507DAU3_9FUNG|nr:hypothetical protein SeLEV6574_g01899 [Synchytrium endobioticum]